MTIRESLTPREFQIASLLVRGYSNKEIATGLWLSPRTVETHRARVIRKLGIALRSELVNRFEAEGLIKFT